MSMLAGDVAAITDDLGWSRFHLVGTAMGGMIAQVFALSCPERVASLTLIATHAGGARNRCPSPLGIWRSLRAWYAISPRACHDAIASLLYTREFCRQMGLNAVRGLVREEFDSPPSRACVLAQYAAVGRHDVRNRLAELSRIATLIVSPLRDILVRPAAVLDMHRAMPGARLVLMPRAGHGVVRQCGTEIATLIEEHAVDAERRGKEAIQSTTATPFSTGRPRRKYLCGTSS